MTEFFCFNTFGNLIAFLLEINSTPMKKIIIFLLALSTFGFSSQKERAFEVGEWFKFRIHYGFINAGYATLEVKEATRNNKKVCNAIVTGYTPGMSRFFFKLRTYMNLFLIKKQGSLFSLFEK